MKRRRNLQHLRISTTWSFCLKVFSFHSVAVCLYDNFAFRVATWARNLHSVNINNEEGLQGVGVLQDHGLLSPPWHSQPWQSCKGTGGGGEVCQFQSGKAEIIPAEGKAGGSFHGNGEHTGHLGPSGHSSWAAGRDASKEPQGREDPHLCRHHRHPPVISALQKAGTHFQSYYSWWGRIQTCEVFFFT